MFKLPLFVSVIVFVAFAMVIEKTVAGDWNGSICGCYKGYCWAYADASYTNKSDWWCYTQMKDIVGKRSIWQRCVGDINCYWDRTYGNCRQYKGDEDQSQNVC